jgi:tetratricopeptide (TPR) repeat protein
MFTTAAPRPPTLHVWAIRTALFAGTMLLFSRALDYGFTNYDDPIYVTDNLQVQSGLTWDGVVWAFTAKADYWHPLTWLSHMLDWQLYGASATGHHLTSAVWHALNAVLVFQVLWRLTGGCWTSAFAAALFAWHPLRVESVVWVTERKDVMSGCFFLLTLWAYARYAERRHERRPATGLYLLTLALFILGLMCKPMLVSLPVVLLILDFWPLGRAGTSGEQWRSWRGLLVEKIPFFVVSAAAAVATLLLQRHYQAFVLDVPPAARVGNALVSVARYLGKFFWPVDLTVCYPHPGYWPATTVIGAALLVLAISVVGWRQRHIRPWLLAGWGWFIIVLLPVIGLVQVGFQAMADRYTYLAIIGPEVALVMSARQIPVRWMPRWLAFVLGGAVLAGCAARTWDQQAVWRTPATLFTHAIAVTTDNDAGEAFLGYTLESENRVDEAARHCERSLELNPRNKLALFELGRVREKQGRFEEAATCYRTVLQLDPGDASCEYRLGRMLLRLRQPARGRPYLFAAVRQRDDLRTMTLQIAVAESRLGHAANVLDYFDAVLAADPNSVDANFELGLAFVGLGRPDEALARYRTVLQLQPNHAGAHAEIGRILMNRGDIESALGQFQAAVANDPNLGVAQLGLAHAADRLGHQAEADAAFSRALECLPQDPAVETAWAEALARRGRFVEALPHYRHAAKLRPDDAGIHVALGFVLYLTHQQREALAEWEEALRLDPAFPGLAERIQRLREEPGS